METAGALKLNGLDVSLNQEISIADITAGKLTFDPAANANGSGYANFKFKVSDGTAYSSASYTETINVTAVNDAPILSLNHGAGTLDPTFDGDGKVTTDFSGASDSASSVAIQPDGKIVVAGYGVGSANMVFELARYNIDGSLDTTFDSDGKVQTNVDLGSIAQSVAVQADGKIVVAGYADNGSNCDFALVRYNSNGSLDTTFDGDGKVTTGIGVSEDYVQSVAIQADGKIVVAGYAVIGSSYDIALARYNSNGSLDTTFDGDGKVITDIGGLNNIAYSVAIQADGKIIVAGYEDNGGNRDFLLVRYNSNGSLDTTFDGDGKMITDISGKTMSDGAEFVSIQNDGKIVVAGRVVSDSVQDIAIARYNSNGSLDTTFDGDGKVITVLFQTFQQEKVVSF